MFEGADRSLLLRLRESQATEGHRLSLGFYGTQELVSCNEHERQIANIGKAVDRFFERCEDTARHTHNSVRCWLRGQILGRTYRAPFDLPGRHSTTAIHRGVCKSMIYVSVRLYRLDPLLCSEYLRARLSQTQERAIQELLVAFTSSSDSSRILSDMSVPDGLWMLEESGTVKSLGSKERRSRIARYVRARTPAVNDEDCTMDTVASDCGSSDTSFGLESDASTTYQDFTGGSSERKPGLGAVDANGGSGQHLGDLSVSVQASDSRVTATTDAAGHCHPDDVAKAMAKLSVFLCTEDFADGLPASTALVYFNGILGFTSDGSAFGRPRNYTPKVLSLIRCIGLCMLERALPRFAPPKLGWVPRPRVGGLKRFIRIYDSLLCHGCQSPTSELISLRSYGPLLCRSDGPSFRVQWDGDEQAVRWEGGRSAMEQLRCLGETALDRARTSMDRLL